MLYAACSLLWAPDPLGSLVEFTHMSLLAGVFILGMQIDSLDPPMTGVALGLGVSMAIGIAQLFGWQGIDQISVPAGLFFNREVFAETVAPVAVWAIGRLPRAIGVAFLTPLVMCQERSALLAVAVGLFYRWQAEWPEKLLAGVLIGLFAAWSLLVFGPDRVLSAEDRFGLWRDALAMTTLWGRGLGAYAALHLTAGFTHSDALQLVAELGVGSAPFFAVSMFAFTKNRLYIGEYTRRDYRAVLVTVLVLAAISFPLHTPTAGFVSALVAGYSSRHDRRPPPRGD